MTKVSAARLLLPVLLLSTTAGCGQPSSSAQRPKAQSSASPAATSLPHVFVIVMENRSPAEVLSAPYTGALAARFAYLNNYHSIATPSLPNYLGLTSGSTWGVADDGYHVLPRADLGTQLTEAGVPWRAYMSGMSEGCFHSPYPYALKHNPFAYYGGACPSNVVPLTELAADLRGATPNLVWITPDLCQDGHDCALAAADAWLRSVVSEITASPAWRQDGILFVVWDEPAGAGDDRVAGLVVAPRLARHTSSAYYDHYSVLATIEDRLGLRRTGEAARAPAITDLLLD